MEKILVGMSGGVDSAVAAFLLKHGGYDVIGYTLKLTDNENKCCNLGIAKAVAEQIGIKHIEIDIRNIFKREIIDYFFGAYKKGITPNPCAKCNIIKFEVGLEYGLKYNSFLIASGHYAQIDNGHLYATNYRKDQAYFLSRLPRDIISRVILPLAGFKKEEIRNIASNNNLIAAHIKDSQDICFIKSNDYRHSFKNDKTFRHSGDIVDSNNNFLSKHEGIANFTVGQKLRMSGMPNKLYVSKIVAGTNTIVADKKENIYRKSFYISNINYLEDITSWRGEIYVKIRSTGHYHKARILNINDILKVSGYGAFDAVTPGQLAVIYKKITDEKYLVLGSGWIE